jgi:undecaprenyl-phosphate 4-deoxy-4-formamido-L-arabinose transferase
MKTRSFSRDRTSLQESAASVDHISVASLTDRVVLAEAPATPARLAKISVIVPVYNSADGLRLLIDRLAPVLGSLASEYEAILVNDGSSDLSWERIVEIHADFPWVRGINLMRNYGQHNALLCGIRAARYPILVTMDDDLQNPPEELPRLLGKLDEGHDVVYGVPEKEQHGLLRDLASKLTKLALQSVMGAETARSASAFRVFRRPVRDAFSHYDGASVSIDVLLTWGTRRFGSVKVAHAPRRMGTSNYRLSTLITHAMNLITGFTTLPLRVATFIGFALCGFGGVVLVYVVGRTLLFGSTVPGFPFLASLISIFSGAQMCALGIIGEYLARMHSRSMGMPSAVIRESIGE